jgi:putative ABC transport system permease protein
VLLRPLPYRDANRLIVVLAERDYDGARRPVRASFPFAAVAAWPRTSALDSVGFYAAEVGALAGGQTAELVDTAVVTGSFFDTVGGEFVRGRGLGPADDLEPAAVISARLWRRVYAGAADVLGQPLTLNGQTFLIVGVASDTFEIPQPKTDVWIPAGVARTRSPTCCGFTPIARLANDATLPDATEELAAIAGALAADMPRALGDTRVQVVRLQDLIVGETRPALVVLLVAVCLLLVLACANVMNLLLARSTARVHETAVRRALGASRGRLVAHALAESAVLAMAGGAGGVALALLSVRALKAWPPVGMPRLDSVAVDGAVLFFACAVVVAATLAVGLLPALQSSQMAGPLKAGRGGRVGRRARFTLRTVTVGQLAMSVILLVGAVLLGRSLAALLRTDLGVTPDHVATASLNLAMNRTLTDAQQVDLIDRIVERIASLPQVTAAGVGAARPPNASRMRLTLNRTDDPDARASYQAAAVPATPGYFPALGVRLERGRVFTDRDDASAPPVVMMSADTARQLFGDQDPLYRTIELPVLRNGHSGREQMTVVGITGNVKYSGLDQMADAVVYRPFAQQPWRSVFLVARTTGDPTVLASQLQREIAAVDRAVTIADVTTLDGVLSDVTSQPRFRTMLLAVFASMAIAIATVGLYGVVAYSVSQRTGEIGIRMALGADGRRIRIMVLREGLVVALFGGLVGLAGAYGATRILTNLLYGTAPTDPASFAVAAVGVIVVGLVASYVPAARAAGADPLVALRTE